MIKGNLVIFFFISLLLILEGAELAAQQTPQYAQFMMNNYGINPAAAGAFSNKFDLMIGFRRQWVGFENMPATSFANITTYFGRKGVGINPRWHAVGFAWQGDRMGRKIKADDFYLSYTFLMRLSRKGYISFGMAAGARQYGMSIMDPLDPALSAKNIWIYPDFIPGIKFFNSKWTTDLTVKQLYKSNVKQGNDMIGSPTKLSPHFYFSASRKWWTKSHLLVIQALQVKYTFATLPSVDYSMIVHLNKYIALGSLYRHLDALAAIVQYRYEKLLIGISYEYSIAPYRIGFANTQEMMIGLSPSPFSGATEGDHYKTAECPKFQY